MAGEGNYPFVYPPQFNVGTAQTGLEIRAGVQDLVVLTGSVSTMYQNGIKQF